MRGLSMSSCSRDTAAGMVLAILAVAGIPRAAAVEPGKPQMFPEPIVMRVESELFTDANKTPMARSLTLFEHGVAWDFLELPPTDEAEAPMVSQCCRSIQ